MQKIENYAQLVLAMASGKITPPDAETWTCIIKGCRHPIKDRMQFRGHLRFVHGFSDGVSLLVSNIYCPTVSEAHIESEARVLAIQGGEK